jgi:hypothetical protein
MVCIGVCVWCVCVWGIDAYGVRMCVCSLC